MGSYSTSFYKAVDPKCGLWPNKKQGKLLASYTGYQINTAIYFTLVKYLITLSKIPNGMVKIAFFP